MSETSLNGAASNRIPATKRVRPSRARATSPTATPAKWSWKPETRHWAMFGVLFMSALSAGLNGYANGREATVPWAGWAMGLAIPVIVLVLAKVAGEKYRAGQTWVATAAGLSGITLLFLSVWHCATSISLLTGSPLMLAMPMAIAIDCGLVSCEVALITEK